MKVKYYTILTFSFLIISCYKHVRKEDNYQKIFHTNEIKFSRNLLRPNMFCVIDSTIVVFENASKLDTLFYSFNINTGKEYLKFGVIGSGPTDYNFPVQMSYNNANKEIQIFDQSYSKQYNYKLDDILNNNNRLNRVDQINAPIEASRFISINDTLSYCLGNFSTGGILGKAVNGEITQTYFEFPDINNKNLTSNQKYGLYQGNIIINNDMNKIVYTSARCDLIKIFSIQKDFLEEVMTQYTYLPKFSDDGSSYLTLLPDNLNGYISVSVTDKYIYALFSGRSELLYKDQHYFGDIVHIFDWDGELIKQIKLDKDAWQIYVNDKSKKIYTIHFEHNNNEETITRYYEYNLPVL